MLIWCSSHNILIHFSITIIKLIIYDHEEPFSNKQLLWHVSAIPGFLYHSRQNQKMIWAYLIHLSYNMWEDNIPLKIQDENYKCKSCQEAREWAHGFRPNLTFDDDVGYPSEGYGGYRNKYGSYRPW